MDKSLGTNLHLRRFFKRAKQTVTREFIYTWSAPPPQPPTYNVGHVYTLFLQSFNIVWGGGGRGEQRNLKTDNSAFLKLRVENTENYRNYSSLPRNFFHHFRLTETCSLGLPFTSLILHIHVMINSHLSNQGIRWPVSRDHIAGSTVQLIEVTCFFEVDRWPSAVFY